MSISFPFEINSIRGSFHWLCLFFPSVDSFNRSYLWNPMCRGDEDFNTRAILSENIVLAPIWSEFPGIINACQESFRFPESSGTTIHTATFPSYTISGPVSVPLNGLMEESVQIFSRKLSWFWVQAIVEWRGYLYAVNLNSIPIWSPEHYQEWLIPECRARMISEHHWAQTQINI